MASPDARPDTAATYLRRDFIARCQRRLPWLILVLMLGFWAFHVFWPDADSSRHSPGQVAQVHAAWETDCMACHTSFTPLGPVYGPTHAGDAKCQKCHAGPPHHPSENADEVHGCASCHQEHRGRDKSLTHMDDRNCTRCHQDLKNHLKSGATTKVADVSRFDGQHHPEVRILLDKAPDPGQLKFNHKLHMAAGLRKTPASDPFTFAHMGESFRERYELAGKPAGEAVQLTCASCHELDPARGSGDYMLPIVYDKHCLACHPLTFARKDPGDARSGLLTLPHRLQPPQAREFLEGHYAGQFLRDLLSERAPAPRVLPGQSPDDDIDKKKALLRAFQQVVLAERELYLSKKSCAECHHFDPDPAALAPTQLAKLHVRATRVPEVWLPKARFNHAAHQQLDCLACHGQAAASSAARDVLLPGIATCLQCHGPASEVAGKPRGGAGFQCTQCHQYHQADQLPHARKTRPDPRPVNIEQFLRGRP